VKTPRVEPEVKEYEKSRVTDATAKVEAGEKVVDARTLALIREKRTIKEKLRGGGRGGKELRPRRSPSNPMKEEQRGQCGIQRTHPNTK